VKGEKEPLVLSRMRRDNLFFDYAVRYVAGHPGLKPDFAVDDAVVKDFRAFLAKRQFKYEEDALTEARKTLELRLRSQIARVKWGAEAESKVLAEGDVQIQKAMTLFDEAAKLAEAGELGRREKESKPADKPTELKVAAPSS